MTLTTKMMHPPGRYLDNVLEQPDILRSLLTTYQSKDWASELLKLWTPVQHLPILVTGMGASDSALWPLWFHLNRFGIATQKIETSELIHYLPNFLERPGFCLVISQSGESIEIQRLVKAIQRNRDVGMKTPALVSVTTEPGNTLSNQSDLALYTGAGPEVGVATKTFTSTMGLLHLIGRCLTGTLDSSTYAELSQIADYQQATLQKWPTWIAPACECLESVKTYAIVGRGPSQAAVDDGALVLKESLRMMAHGFSGGEFRHGPMEMLTSDLGVILFNTPGSTLELSQRLSADVAQRGGALVTVGQREASTHSAHLALPAVDPSLMSMLEILPIQLLAHHVSQSLGLIPGNFQWSGKVVLQE